MKNQLKPGDILKLKNNYYANALIRFVEPINEKLSKISIQYDTLSGLTDPIFENIETQLLTKI